MLSSPVHHSASAQSSGSNHESNCRALQWGLIYATIGGQQKLHATKSAGIGCVQYGASDAKKLGHSEKFCALGEDGLGPGEPWHRGIKLLQKSVHWSNEWSHGYVQVLKLRANI